MKHGFEKLIQYTQELEAKNKAFGETLSKTTDLVVDYQDRIVKIKQSMDELLKLVNEQAEDDGLWFDANFATEGYLQKSLRELHHKVEAIKHKETKGSSAGGGGMAP